MVSPLGPQEHPALTFVQTLYRCRELGSGALARFAGAATLGAVKQGLAAGFPTSHEDHAVCQDTALVAKLVLNDLDATEHGFTCEPTEEGRAALAAVQAAVFGPRAAGRPFTECVFLATLPQATLALELVSAALLDALRPSNCLSLLAAAAGCGHAPLAGAARRLALAAFPAAWRSDPAGLLALPEPLLVGLLGSDALRAPSELEPFLALCAWTEAGGDAARAGLPARLARCVRLGAVGVQELHQMDEHPLIQSDKRSLHLLATVYMGLVMGQPADCPLGYPTSARRRACQRADAASAASSSSSSEAAAAAAAEQAAPRRDCGQSGCSHASVFEAAACALARQRRQRQHAAAAQAAEASMRRLSVDGSADGTAASPAAPGSAARVAPASPRIHDAPTPTAGASNAAAAAAAPPGVQPTARVRHLGISKRCGSRRSLFDLAGDAKQPPAELMDGGKELAPAPLQHVAAGTAVAPADVPVGDVALEMALSPRRASMRALAEHAAAAAAAPQPVGWESRKRLRFD